MWAPWQRFLDIQGKSVTSKIHSTFMRKKWIIVMRPGLAPRYSPSMRMTCILCVT